MNRSKYFLSVFVLSSLLLSGCGQHSQNSTLSTIKKNPSPTKSVYVYKNNQEVFNLSLTINNSKINGQLDENYISHNQIKSIQNPFSGTLKNNNITLFFHNHTFGTNVSTSLHLSGFLNGKNVDLSIPSKNGVVNLLVFAKSSIQNFNTFSDNLNNQIVSTPPTSNTVIPSNNVISNTISNQITSPPTRPSTPFTQSQALDIVKQIPVVAKEINSDPHFVIQFENDSPVSNNDSQTYTLSLGDDMQSNFVAIYWINVRSDGLVQNEITHGNWVLPKNFS